MFKKKMLCLCLFMLMICSICLSEGFKPISDTVFIGDTECKPKQNIITYLLMGIDKEGTVDENQTDDSPGRCDAIYLLIIDKVENTYAVISINRDTITNVHTISRTGEDLAVTPIQIALAHENGDGKEMSCENVVQAVSDLLLGVNIDHYAAVNMDGLRVINHAVGGVDVLIEDDFGADHPDFKQGQILHLSDDQAYMYVRSRQGTGDGNNEGRIRRQKQYMEAIKPLLISSYQNDASFPLKLAHSLDEYMVTDMTDKDYSYIAKAILKNKDLGVFELDGESTIDEMGWVAFYPDEKSIQDIVIKLFYNPKSEQIPNIANINLNP